jgi:histidine triad (HIT) family protein|tara:strand:+ start:331 stop:705 length:375 start_codon:yes stop_codon:yes gene_type:complete
MTYDKNNIFAKILRGEIPLKPGEKIFENEFVLSFYDINPKKKVHALVIPKGEYADLDDFSNRASDKEIVGLIKGLNIVAKKLGISLDGGKGYRALSNIGTNGGQEVSHLHFHLLGGEKVGKMVS